jgi:hypothetical protein
LERHFNEQETAEIIRRAAERQIETRATSDRQGVSESELRRIAGELGIAQGAIDAALQDVGTISATDSGDENSVDRTLERTVLGEVGEEAYAALIDHFQPAQGSQGQAVKIGQTVTYTSMVGMSYCNISVVERAGKTTIKAKSSAWIAAVPTFVAAFFAAIIISAGIWQGGVSPAFKAMLDAAALIALFVGARMAMAGIVRFSNRKAQRLMDDATKDLARSAEELRENLGRSGLPQSEPHTHVQQADL